MRIKLKPAYTTYSYILFIETRVNILYIENRVNIFFIKTGVNVLCIETIEMHCTMKVGQLYCS